MENTVIPAFRWFGMSVKRGWAVLAVAFIAFGTSGCSGGAGAPASTSASTATITIKAFSYEMDRAASPGETVLVRNEDSAGHTVTSDDGTSFNVNVKESGGTATFAAPSKPGSYPFYCRYHPGMRGTLVVK